MSKRVKQRVFEAITLLVVFATAAVYATGSVYAASEIIDITDGNTTYTNDYAGNNYQNMMQVNRGTLPGYEGFGWFRLGTKPAEPYSSVQYVTTADCSTYPQTVHVYPTLSNYDPLTLTNNNAPSIGAEVFTFTVTSAALSYYDISSLTGLSSNYAYKMALMDGSDYCSFSPSVGYFLVDTATPTPTPSPTPIVTPTPTPTPGGPTPTPIIYDASIKLADGQFNWADYVYSYNPLIWTNPNNILGFPDRVYSIVSGVGYPNFFVEFPRILPFPYTYGNLKALRLVIVGGNYSNLMIRPAINHSPVCTAQAIAGTGYSYYTFTVANCPSLRAEYLYQDTAQGSQITYNISSYSNGGSIDAIGYMPIFDSSPSWVATASATGDTAQTLEVCADYDIYCKTRNWLSSNVTYWFGVNIQYAIDQYQALLDRAYSKSPWAYIKALIQIDISDPTTYPTPGIVPDFTIPPLNMSTVDVANNTSTVHTYLPGATISGTTYARWNTPIMIIRGGVLVAITFGWLLFIAYVLFKI